MTGRAGGCTTFFARCCLDPATGEQIGHQVLTVQWQAGRRVVGWPAHRALAPLELRSAARTPEP